MGAIHAVHPPGGWAHQTGQQGDGRTGFGEWLRRMREARGLTLDEVSRETKIPVRNLEALEHGRLGTIPVFYERAEVRAVAKAVGVDERLAIGRLDSAIAPAPESRKDAKAPGQPLELGRAATLLALACGTLLAAGVGRAILDQRAAEPTPVTRTRETPAGAPSSVQEPAAAASQPLDASRAAAAVPVETPRPAVSPESFTEIVVTTEPAGARITVNGIGWGVSPVTIRHLPPGDKHIRATKAGFGAAERRLSLGDGQRRALELQLTTAE